MATREIRVVDGKCFMIVTHEISKEQLEAIRVSQLAERAKIDVLVEEIDAKLPLITDTEV